MRDLALADTRPGPPRRYLKGAQGGEFSNPGLAGPLSCLPNNNNAN